MVKFLCERAENSTTEVTQGSRGGAVQPVRWHTMGHGHPLVQDHTAFAYGPETQMHFKYYRAINAVNNCA